MKINRVWGRWGSSHRGPASSSVSDVLPMVARGTPPSMAGSLQLVGRINIASHPSSSRIAISPIHCRRFSTSPFVIGVEHQSIARSIRLNKDLCIKQYTRLSRSSSYSQPPHLRTFNTSSSQSKMVAENFEDVLKGKYPGKAHAKRVVQLIGEHESNVNGFLYLEATTTKLEEDNDHPVPFRYVNNEYSSVYISSNPLLLTFP